MEWFKAILDVVKSPRLLAAVAIISGFLLFGPKRLRDLLGSDPFVTAHRMWFVSAFLVSSVVLGLELLTGLGKKIADGIKVRMFRANLERRLHDLTFAERAVLAQFIANDTRTVCLDVTSGVVAGLESARVIYCSTTIGRENTGFDYNIQPWAWDYLRAHPELIFDQRAQDPPNGEFRAFQETERGDEQRAFREVTNVGDSMMVDGRKLSGRLVKIGDEVVRVYAASQGGAGLDDASLDALKKAVIKKSSSSTK